MIRALSLAVIALALVYFTGCFVEEKMDPMFWSQDTRLIGLLFGIPLALMAMSLSNLRDDHQGHAKGNPHA
ncbi:hypothetical protein [Azomonas macrocytogenes]|uniref:Peptidoglycan/LPS O-acetylase OafA/YrhL n=1 Tax=Azomonas macrocytogenes TaxID=69962 RepID=A0A839T4G6_AZOMA|nr:hypothetical protein [Azomonas macrocytogenes]MBB3103386.1 peptidoglycan/LPS O-acetylase OafA/YrhL [Azomonas macrocytogenes]